MAGYLSQEWLDLQRQATAGLPERPGVSARLQHVVTGAPGGEARYYTVIEDGRITEAALGDDADADLVLTQTYADGVSVGTGELDVNAAFMQGRLKVVGDIGRLLALQPLTQSADYRAAVAEVAARTEG